MTVAPERYLAACLAVLRRATTLARSQFADSEMIVDVMDAVHNIPDLIQNWEHCDEALLRSSLKDCDAKWPSGLLAAYTFTLERRVV